MKLGYCALFVLLLLFVVPAAGAVDWGQYQKDHRNTGGYVDSDVDGTSWFHETEEPVDSVFRVGDTIYFNDAVDGDLYSLNQTDRSRNWTFESEGNATKAPSVKNGSVYYASSGKFYSLDESTGDVLWSVDTGSQVYPAPAVVNGTVYFVTGASSYGTGGNATVYSVDADEGEVNWRRTAKELTAADVTRGTAIVAFDGSVYVNMLESKRGQSPDSSTGKMYALDAGDGALEWEFSLESPLTLPAANDERVFVADVKGGVRAIDRATGEVSWNRSFGDSIEFFPVYSRDTVYVGSSDGSVHALAPGDGGTRWMSNTSGSLRSVAVVGDRVYTSYNRGDVYALNLYGEDVWNVSLGTGVGAGATVVNRTVYLPADEGFYSIERDTVDEVLDAAADEGENVDDGESQGEDEREDVEDEEDGSGEEFDGTERGDGLVQMLLPLLAALVFVVSVIVVYVRRER